MNSLLQIKNIVFNLQLVEFADAKPGEYRVPTLQWTHTNQTYVAQGPNVINMMKLDTLSFHYYIPRAWDVVCTNLYLIDGY